MASIYKHPNSKFFRAFWYDANGKGHCQSTKCIKRKEAQRVADLWEMAAQRKKSAQHIRAVFAGIFADIYGQAIPISTVRGFSENWLEEKKQESSKATFLAYQTTVTDFLAFLGQRADSDIATVARSDVIAWRASLSARLRNATVNRHIKILRMMFKAAHRDSFILENPVQHVEVTKARQDAEAGRRPFTIPEIQAILAIADPEWQSMIKFGFFTGGRLGDIAQLRWSNINLQRDEIRFVAGKTGKRMTVPICTSLKNHILSLEHGEDPDAALHPRAYETIRRQGYASNLSRWFGELLAQAGLRTASSHRGRGIGRSARRKRQELSFHSLRHSATTILDEAGVPSSVAQALIGHDSEAVHKNYVSVGSEAIRRAVETLPTI
jgi:integrase